MSNSPQMTLEERITQTIKSESLLAIVGDEDAINEMVIRAIDAAIIQPRTIEDNYYSKKHDSPAVEAAREVAQRAAERVTEQMIEKIAADPEFVKLFKEALLTAMPHAMMNSFRSSVATTAEEISAKISTRQLII